MTEQTTRPTTESLTADGWKMTATLIDPGDHSKPSRFRVVLHRGSGPTYETEYGQGAAHREWARSIHRQDSCMQDVDANRLAGWLGLNGGICKGRKVSQGVLARMDRLKSDSEMNAPIFDAFRELTQPTDPELPDVLWSMVMDAQCVEDRSFAEFCGDMGYDTDSRNAFDTYESCQQESDWLNRCGAGVFVKLSELFQDY